MTNAIESIETLKQQVTGSVFAPGDAEYAQVSTPWNLAYHPHPALILVADSAQDIAAGVAFAREQGLGVAVQTTGHGVQLPADDRSLLIVMSRLTGVQVDAQAQTARVEGGARWHHVLDAAAPLGLAPLLGSAPHVGVVGYSLGGGIGWMARRYGLAADHVRSVELVTPDGVLRHVSASENSDLFWGLRGGSGNFGVVTGLEIDLVPVATIYGGNMTYPGELAGEALHFFRDWVRNAPDALTSSIQLFNFPALPFLPEAIRGKAQIVVRAVYVGAADEGQPYIQQWLDWHTPLDNTFRTMPFTEIGTVSNDPVNPAAGYASNEMFASLSDEAIEIIARRGSDKSSPLAMVELRHAGGAISRVPADASAVSNRDAQFYFNIGGPLFGPDAKAASIAAITQFKAELQPYFHGGVYLNFMSGDDARSRAKDAYSPEAYQRLLALKAKYDPDNVFRYSYPLVTTELSQA